MKFITFQKPNLNHLFFIAYFLTMIAKRLISDEIFEVSSKSSYIFTIYYSVLSHILSLIPYLIIKIRSRSKIKAEEKANKASPIKFIFTDRKNKYKGKNLFKYTLLVSLFSFLSEATLTIINFVNDKLDDDWISPLNIYVIINCVILYIDSHFILKTNFYKHHYLSFTFNFVCFLITLIIDIIQMIQGKITRYKYYIYIIMRLIRINLSSIFDCYAKLAMFESFLSPYSLLAYMALYNTFFLIIYTIPFIFINITDTECKNEIIFVRFLNYLSGTKLFYTILIFINSFLSDLFIIYIIDKFSPSHLTLAISLEPFFVNTYIIIRNKNKGRIVDWNIYVNFVIFFILIIGSMIHNEIFIINKWGLNKKTKLFLNKEFHEENVDVERFLTSDELDENEEKKENVNDNELTNNK